MKKWFVRIFFVAFLFVIVFVVSFWYGFKWILKHHGTSSQKVGEKLISNLRTDNKLILSDVVISERKNVEGSASVKNSEILQKFFVKKDLESSDTFFDNNLRIGGNLLLSRIKINGNVNVNGKATISESILKKNLSVNEYLEIENSTVEGAVRGGQSFYGINLILNDVSIERRLNLKDSKINGVLNIGGNSIVENSTIDEGLYSKNTVRLIESTVKGVIQVDKYLRAYKNSNLSDVFVKHSLEASDVKIHGSVNVEKYADIKSSEIIGNCITESLRLSFCKIFGNLFVKKDGDIFNSTIGDGQNKEKINVVVNKQARVSESFINCPIEVRSLKGNSTVFNDEIVISGSKGELSNCKTTNVIVKNENNEESIPPHLYIQNSEVNGDIQFLGKVEGEVFLEEGSSINGKILGGYVINFKHRDIKEKKL